MKNTARVNELFKRFLTKYMSLFTDGYFEKPIKTTNNDRNLNKQN